MGEIGVFMEMHAAENKSGYRRTRQIGRTYEGKNEGD
jgi:hypothetical protein